MYKRYQQIFGIKTEISSEEYPGKYLIHIAQLIADSDNDKWLKHKEVERKKSILKNLLLKSWLNLLN